MKYKFSSGVKYGNKKPGKYRKKEIRNMSGVKYGSVGDGKQDILFMVLDTVTLVFMHDIVH